MGRNTLEQEIKKIVKQKPEEQESLNHLALIAKDPRHFVSMEDLDDELPW